MTAFDITEVRGARYEFTIRIDAPDFIVWDALAEAIDQWWPPAFRVLGSGSVVKLDARAGGQLLEEGSDGTSLCWFTVQLAKPDRELRLVGPISPQSGGPAISTLSLELAGGGYITNLKLTDALFGVLPESLLLRLQNGWETLLGDGLKPWAEARWDDMYMRTKGA